MTVLTRPSPPLAPPPRLCVQFLQSSGAVDAVHTAVVSLAAASPAFLAPVIATLGGDVESLLTFQPTADGIARLLVRRVCGMVGIY